MNFNMHRVTVTVVVLLLTALGLCVSAVPRSLGHGGPIQQRQAPVTPTPGGQGQEVERVFTRRVRLPVTVIDKKGMPVAGLTANDFLVMEDKARQQIESFTDGSGGEQPLYVGVLIDTSPSAIAKLRFSQVAAMTFLRAVLRPRRDKAALVNFDDEIKLRQEFTERLDLVERTLRGLKKPGTHTSLYDAVWQFCNENMRGADGRRALVIISDGEDTYSRATLREAIDAAQRMDTTVFAVSTKGGFTGAVPGMEAGQVAGEGDRALAKLCEETGGRAFFTGDQVALEQSFARIAQEVRSQYVITYRPTNEQYDGRFRRIEVKLVGGRDGLKVRSKRGYSAVADGAAAPR
jgi:Ca-activated chloride channel homolog